ncbi:MAG: penicillin-binding transpeptidase domain-containing protein [Lachnospiraceae bacterium]
MKTSRNKERIFTKYMQEKLAITVIVITLALFALVYILYNIIQTNKDRYNQIVLSQQEYDSRIIPYRRGDIVDRNGTLLATTEKVYNLIIDPKQIMSSQEDYLEATIAALAAEFGYDTQELRTLITENSGKQYVRYARQLNYEDKEAFEILAEETNLANRKNNSKARIKGIWFEDEYKRIYPYNSLACNVIGFATSSGDGGTGGIEQSYNDQLIGINGREYGYLNDDSNLERVIKSATNGNTVVSTIDVNIQNIVDKYIAAWQQEAGSERVGVVVMDPNNGEILAMSSDKLFDLNNPRDLEGRYTEAEIRELGLKEARDTYNRKNQESKPITVEEATDHYSEEEIRSFGQQVAWNQIWRNFCVSDTYEPGSPSKIFTVAAGLEEGILSGNESFYCDGGQEVGGWLIKCVKRTGHGMLTLTESLMQSCNDCMMQIAAMEGRETFSKYMQMFGFGSKTGIDLPGEADTRTLVYDASNMKASDLATNSFGQNYNCTMIQMAAAYCSIINGGSYYEPHVVKQVVNEQDAIVKRVEPNLVRETVSESTSNFIKEALFRTVEEGTGTAAAIAGYEIAGKTGTAEKYPRGQGNYLLSFCGFAPVHNPQVLVYVIIDTPQVENRASSSHASKLFQQIMSDILPYWNVFPSGDFEDTQEGVEGQLPEQEGISGNNGGLETETEAEIKVYETDEFVDPEDERNTGIPGDLPGEENPDGSYPAESSAPPESEGTAGTSAAAEAAAEPAQHEDPEDGQPGQVPIVDPNPS